MPSFRSTRTVRHAADEMFDLVADVERYPEFVPLCQSLTVRRRVAGENGREEILADMRVGYKSIRESFVSRVILDRAHLEIVVEYVDGPFRRMENRWSFVDQPSEGAARRSSVEFFIDYEFRSRIFAALMGQVFDAAFRRFAEAFERRADEIYRHRSSRTAERG